MRKHHPTQSLDGEHLHPSYTVPLTEPEHDHEHRICDALGIGRTATATTPFEVRRLALQRDAADTALTLAEMRDERRLAQCLRCKERFYAELAEELESKPRRRRRPRRQR